MSSLGMLGLAMAWVSLAAPSTRTGLLVMPLVAEEGAPPSLAEVLTDALLAEAIKNPSYRLKSTQDIQQVLKQEELKQMLGCSMVSCASDLAQLMEAEQVIRGRVTRVGSEYVVSLIRLRTVDGVSLSRVSERVQGRDSQVLAKMPSLVTQLLTDVKVDPVTVELKVLAKRKGTTQEVPMQAGEKLQQGDHVAFEFTVTPQAHVYLVQKTKASGSIQVLFPNPEIASVSNPLPAGVKVRIPGNGQTFEVDNQDLGMENVYVVASTRELPRLNEAVARITGSTPQASSKEQTEGAMVALLSGGGSDCHAKGSLDGAEAKPGCKGRTRGLQLKNSGSNKPTHTARVRSSPGDDTVFYTFTFEHVAAPTP